MKYVYLDRDRRIVLYPEGGCTQERNYRDVGWCLADDEDWTDAVAAHVLGALDLARRWGISDPAEDAYATLLRDGADAIIDPRD